MVASQYSDWLSARRNAGSKKGLVGRPADQCGYLGELCTTADLRWCFLGHCMACDLRWCLAAKCTIPWIYHLLSRRLAVGICIRDM
jgi:hypothetical protein